MVVTETDVVITFAVEALPSGVSYTCVGNDAVAYAVDLGQPLEGRTLVDGTCRGLESTSWCS